MAKRSLLRLVEEAPEQPANYKRRVGELWTAQQRQMHSLHYVVSYRGSFKPELPDYCIRRYSNKGDVVYDPFSGRGTTALQANLLGRVAKVADINPLAVKMTRAKTEPVGLDEVVLRLNEIDFRRPVELTGYQENFAPFYHPDTYRELINLKNFVRRKPDRINNFIELIALSRLHGHSPGFFSVYSFPQISIPPANQRQINIKRGQVPDYRAVAPRIIKKAAQSLRDGFSSEFFQVSAANDYQAADARDPATVKSNSVDLVVFSPPFLDKVDYLLDNWLEFWFSGIDPRTFGENLIMCRSLAEWREFISRVLGHCLKALRPDGYLVIEVGEVEVNGETIYLDEIVAEEASRVIGSGTDTGKRLVVQEVLINKQSFTKLSNCFNVDNNKKGTNTNRLVVIKCLKRARA